MVVHPIGIGIPGDLVVSCVPEKRYFLANVSPNGPGLNRCVPKSTHTQIQWSHDMCICVRMCGRYAYSAREEAEYHRAYRHAYFAVSRKKAGWDCLRHYEILAAGTVPLFLNVSHAPQVRSLVYCCVECVPHTYINLCVCVCVQQHSIGMLPRRLLENAWALPGITLTPTTTPTPSAHNSAFVRSVEFDGVRLTVDDKAFNETAYTALASELLQYTRTHLTTDAIADYVLKVCTVVCVDCVLLY